MRCDYSEAADRSPTYAREVVNHISIEGDDGEYKCDMSSKEYDRSTNSQLQIQNMCGVEDFSGIAQECSLNNDISAKHTNSNHTQNAIERKYKCLECSKRFIRKHNLKLHMKNKHTENGSSNDYKCSECDVQTKHKESLTLHLNTHDNVKSVQCGICTRKFTLQRNLRTHTKNKHTENPIEKKYKCPECPHQTDYKHVFNRHVITHSGIKPFECDICKIKFTRKDVLGTHIKAKHMENEIGEDYKSSESSLQTNNSLRHSSVKPYQCDVCLTKFTSKDNLRKHIKDEHPEIVTEKKYKCPDCPYQTDSRYFLNEHTNIHNGIKPFECDVCMIKFTSKSNYKKHIKNKHTENELGKDFKCTECSYQTNHRHILNRHMTKHTGIKPFECDVCKMKFTRKDTMRMHIKHKHMEGEMRKFYKCSKCSFDTNYKYDLNKHMDAHI